MNIPVRYSQLLSIFIFAVFAISCMASPPAMKFEVSTKWVSYQGTAGKPGSGKHIVLVAGDEEYRSEEAMPQLGKILAKHHGFNCVVLFSQGEDGFIDPMNQKNIPGLENLKNADLMMLSLRFRNLPNEQMKPIDDYLKTGRPVLGMRTSTHAFFIKSKDSQYKHYSWRHGGDPKEWKQGFGRFILGETWINHHGGHGSQSTGGLLTEAGKKSPITNGIKDGDIWGPTDVYGVRLPLPGDSQPLVLGAVLKGMKKGDAPVEGKKNEPMMPVGWTKSYQLPGGKKGQVFNTTMGASTDLVAEGSRRMIVNAVYQLTGLDVPKEGANVEIVGEFKPNNFGFAFGKTVRGKKIKPNDLAFKTK